MSSNHSHRRAPLVQTFDKFLLSGFVIFSFIAYTIHQRFTHPDSPVAAANPSATAEVTSPTAPVQSGTVFSQTAPLQSAPAQTIPTQPPPPTPTTEVAISNGRYKDGVYNGPTVNAYYGLVSVQATVQNGSIVDVKFLQYPNDRRTSIRINSIAMPYLQQEAIQAQTANVNLISGATLTSEGFVISLRAALQSAVN